MNLTNKQHHGDLAGQPKTGADERPGAGSQEAPVVTTEVSARREKFIPVTRFALIEHLKREDARSSNPANIAKFFTYLSAWRHQTYVERLMRLKECYMPFSPDRDTVRVTEFTDAQLLEMRRDFVKNIDTLMERANYKRITDDNLHKKLSAQSGHGLELHVDLNEFDEVRLYFRGRGHETLVKRDPKWAYLRKKEIDIPIYQRLFLLLKLKPEENRIEELMKAEKSDRKVARKHLRKLRRSMPPQITSDHIYLKLFKNIPREDLEMMFPNTQVKFKLFDKIKLGVTAGGGTIAGMASSITKLLAVSTNPLAMIGALAGLIGLLVRQAMKFFNTRNKYMMELAQRLYFHSLADNRGVLTLLVDRAEEEDIKEEMLLFFFLLRRPTHRDSLHELDLYIEEFLTRTFGVIVDFDIDDALERLLADKIVSIDAGGQLLVMAPEQACAHLEARWKTYLSDAANAKKDSPLETNV